MVALVEYFKLPGFFLLFWWPVLLVFDILLFFNWFAAVLALFILGIYRWFLSSCLGCSFEILLLSGIICLTMGSTLSFFLILPVAFKCYISDNIYVVSGSDKFKLFYFTIVLNDNFWEIDKFLVINLISYSLWLSYLSF